MVNRNKPYTIGLIYAIEIVRKKGDYLAQMTNIQTINHEKVEDDNNDNDNDDEVIILSIQHKQYNNNNNML